MPLEKRHVLDDFCSGRPLGTLYRTACQLACAYVSLDKPPSSTGVAHRCLSRRTPPPQVDTDLDLLPWIAPRGRLALDHQPGMISSAFIETVKLMAIGDKILNTLSVSVKCIRTRIKRTLIRLALRLALQLWNHCRSDSSQSFWNHQRDQVRQNRNHQIVCDSPGLRFPVSISARG